MPMLTLAEAAKILKVTVRRVQAMCSSGRLKARKLGRDWRIRAEDLEAVKDRNKKGGRPRKEETENHELRKGK